MKISGELRSILNAIDDAIFILEQSNIVFANKGAESYFGECEGSNILDFLIFEKSTILVEAIHEMKPVDFESKVFLTKRGGWGSFHFKYVPQSQTLILKDITLAKNVEEAKVNMSVLISHELKTPIGAMKVFLSDLLENEEEKEKIGKLWEIAKQVQRLERIIQQIEYITMAQLGIYEPKKEHVNVHKILSEVLEDVEELVKAKNIRIETKVSTKFINTDVFIFRTILKNLLSNAIKYSFDNSTVIVDISDERLIVQDFGVGVADSEKEKIFERFYRTPTAVKMASGSGLGLSVVKHLANVVNYKIEFESQHLIGTKVSVWFQS
ncbi:MAG: ATP-binding protein [Fervidobacterium sp.]